MSISVEKKAGFILCSTVYKGYLVTRKYFFYNKKGAVNQFKQYLKTI